MEHQVLYIVVGFAAILCLAQLWFALRVLRAYSAHLDDAVRLLGSRSYTEFADGKRVEAGPNGAVPLTAQERSRIAEEELRRMAESSPDSIV